MHSRSFIMKTAIIVGLALLVVVELPGGSAAAEEITDCQQPKDCYQKAEVFMEQAKYDEAIVCYDRTLELAKHLLVLHFYLGLAHRANGSKELALYHFRQFLRAVEEGAIKKNVVLIDIAARMVLEVENSLKRDRAVEKSRRKLRALKGSIERRLKKLLGQRRNAVAIRYRETFIDLQDRELGPAEDLVSENALAAFAHLDRKLRHEVSKPMPRDSKGLRVLGAVLGSSGLIALGVALGHGLGAPGGGDGSADRNVGLRLGLGAGVAMIGGAVLFHIGRKKSQQRSLVGAKVSASATVTRDGLGFVFAGRF